GPVVRRQAASGQAVEEDWNPQRRGELAQRALAVAPVEVGAGHYDRALGTGEQRGDLLNRVSIGRRKRSGIRYRCWFLGVVGLHEDDVQRKVEEGWPGRDHQG